MNLSAGDREPNLDSRLVAWESDGAILFLREQADRCRRLARGTNDPVTQERLSKLAAEYEAQADAQAMQRGIAPVRYGKREEDNN